jgi:carboxylesterase type B
MWGANTNDSASALALEEHVGYKKYVKALNTTLNGGRAPEMEYDLSDELDSQPSRRRRRQRQFAHHRARVLGTSTAAESEEFSSNGGLAPDLLERALKLYPAKHHENNAASIGWFASEQFLCSTRRLVLAASKAVSGGGQAFMYRFDWFFQSNKNCTADSNWHTPASGSNHCDEMSFVFGQPIYDEGDAPGLGYTNCSDPASAYFDPHCFTCHFDAREARFSLAVGKFWTQFAATGAPGAAWPAFTPTARKNIVLRPSSAGIFEAEEDVGRPEACALWDEVAAAHSQH